MNAYTDELAQAAPIATKSPVYAPPALRQATSARLIAKEKGRMNHAGVDQMPTPHPQPEQSCATEIRAGLI